MKWVKRIFLTLLIAAVIIGGLATWAGYHYRGMIVPVVTQQLNKNLQTKVHVDTIQLTFLKHFPMASVEFENAIGLSSNPNSQFDTLFKVKRLYLSFSLIDLYKGNYKLREIEAENGFMHMDVDQNNRHNFEFWNSQNDTSSSNFSIALEKVTLDELHYRFAHQPREENFSFQIQKITGKGDFSSTDQNIALYGKLKVDDLKIGNIHYLPGEELSLDAGMEMNPKNNFYQVSRGTVTLRNRYDLHITGKTTAKDLKWNIDGQNLNIAVLSALMPDKVTTFFNDFKGKGKLNFDLNIERQNENKKPSINSEFTIENGSLDLSKYKIELANLNTSGRYTNGGNQNAQSSQIHFDTLSGKLNGAVINGRFRMQNFIHPLFESKFTAEGNINQFDNLIKPDTISSWNIPVKIDAAIAGRIMNTDSISYTDFINWEKEINLTATKAGLKVENSPYTFSDLTANLNSTNNDIKIEKLNGLWGSDSLDLSGTWRNALPFFQKENTKPFRFFGNIFLQKFDYNEFQKKQKPDSSEFTLPKNVLADIKLSINELIYDQSRFEKVHSRVSVRAGLIEAKRFQTNAYGGNMNGKFLLRDGSSNVKLIASTQLNELDVQQLFTAFNNFGQQEITADHLRGKLTSSTRLSIPIDRNANVIFKQLDAVADLQIANGELIDYKPLQGVTDVVQENKFLRLFIKLDDFEERLKHVKFDTLQNTLRIKNEVVTIPGMQISSSALNIDLSGEHHFNNDIDYKLSFNLKEVLQKKDDKWKQSDFGYIADDGTGNMQLFLHIHGNVDDPIIDFDKSARKQNRKQIVEREVQTTKAILKDELGLFKGDTTIPEIEEPTEQEYELEFDPSENKDNDDKSAQSGSDREPEKEEKKGVFKKFIDKLGVSDTTQSKFEDWEIEDEDL
ncbi:MAG: AsmA-like C-terminal region-containing protein [Salibacter sp.]|uniref:AsmA-like C-terminal region-containing protein n=1 Tax=Salibacter sp. TaxID=2010995 RepID=UPI0028708825|nr:AsmA-like C-terminal region-containing protein [Salibacter sp.]MDR9399527.1 AsmA-like C-terminal region-containing protein [Salibacter sp.]